MDCSYCGKEQPEDAVYCNQCGKKLQDAADGESPAIDEAGISADEEIAAAAAKAGRPEWLQLHTEQAVAKPKNGSLGPVLLPVIVFFLSASGVFAYYLYESHINETVMKWQVQAQQEGLNGRYEEALRLLGLAMAERPEYGALQDDAAALREAVKAESKLAEINGLIDKQSFSEAGLQLEQLRSKLSMRNIPVFDKVGRELAEASVNLSVEQSAAQLDTLKTADALLAKWQEVQGLEGDKASRLQERLKEKIIDACYQEASGLLARRYFSEALAMVEAGLEHDAANQKLTALQAQIENEKKKFEAAEQQRIEDAMQQAASEDLHNHTAAVEVVRIEQKLDKTGRLTLKGYLTNAATRPIYSVQVQFTVYAADGTALASGEAEAAPGYVEPGETMTFEWTAKEITFTGVEVDVDHATWYLD